MTPQRSIGTKRPRLGARRPRVTKPAPVTPLAQLLAAALFSAAGCLVGLLAFLGIKVPLTPLPLFGVYCLLIGYLIIRSTFLPRILGVLLMIGGVSWLTFAYVPFARMLAPYNYVPGIVAEGLLTLWLLVMALDTRRWWEQSALAQSRR